MKKIFLLFFILIVAVITLTACGQDGKQYDLKELPEEQNDEIYALNGSDFFAELFASLDPLGKTAVNCAEDIQLNLGLSVYMTTQSGEDTEESNADLSATLIVDRTGEGRLSGKNTALKLSRNGSSLAFFFSDPYNIYFLNEKGTYVLPFDNGMNEGLSVSVDGILNSYEIDGVSLRTLTDSYLKTKGADFKTVDLVDRIGKLLDLSAIISLIDSTADSQNTTLTELLTSEAVNPLFGSTSSITDNGRCYTLDFNKSLLTIIGNYLGLSDAANVKLSLGFDKTQQTNGKIKNFFINYTGNLSGENAFIGVTIDRLSVENTDSSQAKSILGVTAEGEPLKFALDCDLVLPSFEENPLPDGEYFLSGAFALDLLNTENTEFELEVSEGGNKLVNIGFEDNLLYLSFFNHSLRTDWQNLLAEGTTADKVLVTDVNLKSLLPGWTGVTAQSTEEDILEMVKANAINLLTAVVGGENFSLDIDGKLLTASFDFDGYNGEINGKLFDSADTTITAPVQLINWNIS